MTDGGREPEAGGRDVVAADVGLPAERRAPSALQVARGVGGMALLWGGGWAALNVAFTFGLALLTPWNLAYIIPSALRLGVWGALCGGAFAAILTVAERRKSLDELSLLRVGVWGGLGAFGIVFIMILVSGILPILGLDFALLQAAQGGILGALSAVGTTWVAKQAPEGE